MASACAKLQLIQMHLATMEWGRLRRTGGAGLGWLRRGIARDGAAPARLVQTPRRKMLEVWAAKGEEHGTRHAACHRLTGDASKPYAVATPCE